MPWNDNGYGGYPALILVARQRLADEKAQIGLGRRRGGSKTHP